MAKKPIKPPVIKIPSGAPAKPGMCPIRPPLDGSKGNPMLFCSFRIGHEGKHSWEK